MGDFSSTGLLALAKTRYGEEVLRARIRGGPGQLARVDVVTPGAGFGGTAPTVDVTGFISGSGAVVIAELDLTGDFIAYFLITNPGSNFKGSVAATITPANGATANAFLVADVELLRIAQSVISRAQSALMKSDRWPIPGKWPAGSVDPDGTDISGLPYAQVWPYNLLENALELFNWRTLAGLEQASSQQQRVGAAAEKFFQAVDSGDIAIGIDTALDVGPPEPFAARNRDGSSNLPDIPDRDNVLDTFSGPGWDF